MGRYWFTKKYKHVILNVETVKFPFRMILLLDENMKAQVDKIMDNYLVQETPAPSMFDKAADWIQEKVPMDREEKVTPPQK